MKRLQIILFGIGTLLGIFAGFVILFFSASPTITPQANPLQSLVIKRPIIFGFLPYWLVGKAEPDYSQKLTTLAYYGLTIDIDGHIVQRISRQEPEVGFLKLHSTEVQQKLADAKKNNLTLSLVVGNQDTASISALISQPTEHAQNLMNDVTPLMNQYGFTDLNIDIESFHTASDSARANFTQFLKTIRENLDQKKGETLSIDLAPAQIVQPRLVQPSDVAQVVDTVIMMAYDYSSRASYITGPVAPVNGEPEVRNFDIHTSLTEALKVIPAGKLILGIPLYGYQWETIGKEPYSPVIPSSGVTASQNRIHDELSSCSNCTTAIDPISLEPYFISPGTIDGIFQQTFYEDEASLQKKIDITRTNHLAGVALWALGYENPDMLRPLIPYKNEVMWRK